MVLHGLDMRVHAEKVQVDIFRFRNVALLHSFFVLCFLTTKRVQFQHWQSKFQFFTRDRYHCNIPIVSILYLSPPQISILINLGLTRIIVDQANPHINVTFTLLDKSETTD